MKREGRQHGMVRSYTILPSPWNQWPNSNMVNRFDSPPTAGLHTKVSSKPTNHSKFTGKCGRPRCARCHINPACKSKDKVKGTQKLKSSDVAINHRLINWRVVDKGMGLNYAGKSATAILKHLSNDYWDDEVEDDVDAVYDDSATESRFVPEENEIGSGEIAIEDEGEDEDDDDNMSFCDVGFVIEQVDGDEGWCLVGEL